MFDVNKQFLVETSGQEAPCKPTRLESTMKFRSLGPVAKRSFKDDVYAAFARIPAAVSNPHRLEILELIAQRPRTVVELATETALSVANASQHLQVLAKCGLVTVERRGTFAFYRAAGTNVYRLLQSMRDVADHNDAAVSAVFEKHLGRREAGISDLNAVRALIANPRVTLLDTRPSEEYVAGHFPRAINAPLEALKSGKIALPKSKRYVAYCRGPYCVFADEAVAYLRERGFDATRLALSPMDWEAAGEQVSGRPVGLG